MGGPTGVRDPKDNGPREIVGREKAGQEKGKEIR